MNQIYRAFCNVLLAVLLLVMILSFFDKEPVRSELENRDLKQKPSLTIEGILDGSYFREYQLYFADTFPNRENMLDDYAIFDPNYELQESVPAAESESAADPTT